jgi:DNA-directed RNA polymerase subunit RPC12/RpoP
VESNVSDSEDSYVPNLEHDERTVFVETCRHKDVFGNLFLTNKRLIFEHESGIFTKRVYVTLDLSLEGVSSVSIEGRLGKKLVVNAKKGFVSNFPVRLDFTVKDPVQWQSRIENASKAKIESIEAERRKERIQVVLDFGALKDYMFRGALVLQTMKCPECGAPIRMPDMGNQTKCEHCGHTILAQDIFDKIRRLI